MALTYHGTTAENGTAFEIGEISYALAFGVESRQAKV